MPVFDPNAEDMQQELENLRTQVEEKAVEMVNWYLRRKNKEAAWSRYLRVIAIIFTTLGTLLPILQGTGKFDFDLGQFGYVALVFAGAAVASDKYFGFSTAWMRYMTTEMALQRELAAFQMDWVILLNNYQNASEEGKSCLQVEMLERLKTFRLQVFTQVQQEMQLWISEFNENLTRLELKTKLNDPLSAKSK